MTVPVDCKLFLDNSISGYCYLETSGYYVSENSEWRGRWPRTEPETAARVQRPRHIAFPTLKTLFKSFQEHGTPGRIDRSVLTNFSGSVGGQIIPALRFLRLIDPSNHPTEDLRSIVKDYGTTDWHDDLKILLEKAYAPLSGLNLKRRRRHNSMRFSRRPIRAPRTWSASARRSISPPRPRPKFPSAHTSCAIRSRALALQKNASLKQMATRLREHQRPQELRQWANLQIKNSQNKCLRFLT